MSNDDVVIISSDSDEDFLSFCFRPKRRRLPPAPPMETVDANERPRLWSAASQPCRRPAVQLFDPVLITLDDNVEEPASVDNDKTPALADEASSAPANTPVNPAPTATGHAVTADCSLSTTTPAQQKEPWKVVLWHEPMEINKFSCECKDDCGEDCPCVQTDNHIYPNNKYNNTTRHFETVVNSENVYDNTKDDFYKHGHVMCGPACSCSSSCRIKYPPEASHKFEVFKRDSKMGFGLRCLNNIRTGEFVTEFMGEYMEKPDPKADDNAWHNFYNYSLNVSDLELASRNKDYGDLMTRFAEMFPKMKKAILRYQPKKAYIMPYTKGNVSRFVAHGCLPNVYMMRIIVNTIQPEAHRIIFVASEDIPAGTEILFDYGSDYFEDKNIECRCNTPLCSNTNELPFLATLLEHIEMEDIWNLIEQRAINNSLLSRHFSDVFAAWEFAIFNGKDVDRRIAKSRIEGKDIDAQVKNLLELIKQDGPSNKSDRAIPLGGYVLAFETLPLSNKKWPTLIEDKVNRVLEKYQAASMRQDLPQHPGKLPSKDHFKELLCRLFLANERGKNVKCVQVEDWFPDQSNAEKFSKWRG